MTENLRNVAAWILCLPVLVTGSLSGCGALDESDSPSVEAVTFDAFAPHIWSADEGIDLFSRGSELLRASFEAKYYWPVIEEVDDFFPGYTNALVNGRKPGEPARFSRREQYLTPLGETLFVHITDYSATDTEVSGTICRYVILATDEANGTVEMPTSAYRIVLKNSATGAGLPGIADVDPNHGELGERTPSWDVFGTWKIESGRPLGAEKPPENGGNGVPPGCHDWWLKEFPSLTFRSPGDAFRKQPEGFVPPVMPVGVQYPGWIGPSNVA